MDIKKMKHHLYQIYYGGWKNKLPNIWYCEICHAILLKHGELLHMYTEKTHRVFNDK